MRHLGVGLSLHATAVAAASPRALTPVTPVRGDFLGYEFEWGPMIAGLLACAAVRFYISRTEPAHRWTVDAPVTALMLLVTAGLIQAQRPIPIVAIALGTGAGALGVGFIQAASAFLRRNLGPLAPPDPPKP